MKKAAVQPPCRPDDLTEQDLPQTLAAAAAAEGAQPAGLPRAGFWAVRPWLWAGLLFLAGAAVLLVCWPVCNAAWRRDALAPHFAAVMVTVDGRQCIDLNTADAATLQTLPDIGPALAGAIIDHRTAHGPFAAVDDLLQVQGIGPATLETLREYVAVAPEPAS